jgi:signal transduction histidine kinase/ligand-binding sensor domain-containing protein
MTAARAMMCLTAVLASHGSASALNPALEISQYAHTTWKVGESFLDSRVLSIAQTPDGYLWLGTETGLLRFDGVRTVAWQPAAAGQLSGAEVLRLLVAADGRLWIGTSRGLASWKDERVVVYPELAGHIVAALAEGSGGTVWAGSITVPNARLCAIGGTVQCHGEDGRFGNGVFSLFEERGTLWVRAATGLWQWIPGQAARRVTPASDISHMLRLNDDTLLAATQGGVRQMTADGPRPYPIPGVDRLVGVSRLLVDRDRGLWIGTTTRGLVHASRGQADLFTRADGLSGDWVHALFEDREGNVWVATNRGLDRFRELAVATWSQKQGLASEGAYAVLPARDGRVWVASPDGLTRWTAGRATVYQTGEGLPDNRIGTLFEDSAGRILAATLGGIAAFDGNRFVPIRSLPTRIVYNIVEPRAGELWINDQDQGLIHAIGDKVVRRISWPALGRDDHANALVVDPVRNGLWAGFFKGGVAFLSDGVVRSTFGAAEGLGAGRVAHLRLDQEGAVWAATASGLSRIKDRSVTTLSPANGLPCADVHWTIPDADGSLWLLLQCGLARIRSDELAAWVSDPSRRISSTVFNSSDGLKHQATPIGFGPPAALLPDGRLWFTTPEGVGVVDPRQLPFNAQPPPVQIEQIVADRESYATGPITTGLVRLPARVRDVQIDYTALSLVAPHRLQFRYRLEGYDRDWQDAGTRRQAFYSRLGPGQYRFQVIAANNSGVWNDTGAAVELTIPPAYYQTTWFLALAIGAAAALVWSTHRIRLRVVEKHQGEISALNERLMKAQEQERIRIAGELHDGVMQEMLAATMLLGSAKRRVDAQSEAHATIDKVQEKLVRAGTEIRQLSHDLHPPALQDAGLPDALRLHCEQFSASCGIAIDCDADDSVHELSRGAALALFRIVQEALANAAKHSRATRIVVRLARAKGEVTLTVSDNGLGFDRGRLTTSGGLGLITMRERAGQLNGRFEFDSTPGRGTAITVVVPFR